MKKHLTILLALTFSIHFFAQDNDSLKKIDDFSATDDAGNVWNSSEVTTDFLVVYFYPAAMTGGCTKQACAYRDDKSTFDKLGVSVVAVSGDEVKNLAYFKNAYQLNFPLLSDNDGKISTIFNVPTKDGGSINREIGGEQLLLTRGITTPRWTFVLNKNREIIYKNAEVNASEDSKKVKEVIEKYKTSK